MAPGLARQPVSPRAPPCRTTTRGGDQRGRDGSVRNLLGRVGDGAKLTLFRRVDPPARYRVKNGPSLTGPAMLGGAELPRRGRHRRLAPLRHLQTGRAPQPRRTSSTGQGVCAPIRSSRPSPTGDSDIPPGGDRTTGQTMINANVAAFDRSWSPDSTPHHLHQAATRHDRAISCAMVCDSPASAEPASKTVMAAWKTTRPGRNPAGGDESANNVGPAAVRSSQRMKPNLGGGWIVTFGVRAARLVADGPTAGRPAAAPVGNGAGRGRGGDGRCAGMAIDIAATRPGVVTRA
jgi:hypothetical protein